MDNIFIGNLKTIKGEFGEFFSGSICLSDIPKELMTTSEKNNKKYLSVTVNKNKNGLDDYGNSHSIKINTWKPKKENKKFEDDIPF